MSLAHTLALLLSGFALWFLFVRQGVCTLCSGRGRHRSDCPNARQDDRRGHD